MCRTQTITPSTLAAALLVTFACALLPAAAGTQSNDPTPADCNTGQSAQPPTETAKGPDLGTKDLLDGRFDCLVNIGKSCNLDAQLRCSRGSGLKLSGVCKASWPDWVARHCLPGMCVVAWR